MKRDVIICLSLEEFLKEKGVYDQFLANTRVSHLVIAPLDSPIVLLEHGVDALPSAFIWKNTPEGFDFWYELYQEITQNENHIF